MLFQMVVTDRFHLLLVPGWSSIFMVALRWHQRLLRLCINMKLEVLSMKVRCVSQHRVQNVEEVPGAVKGGQQEPAGLSSTGFCSQRNHDEILRACVRPHAGAVWPGLHVGHGLVLLKCVSSYWMMETLMLLIGPLVPQTQSNQRLLDMNSLEEAHGRCIKKSYRK